MFCFCLFLQSSGYMFGAHTKRRQLTIGDRVLALCDPGNEPTFWTRNESSQQLNNVSSVLFVLKTTSVTNLRQYILREVEHTWIHKINIYIFFKLFRPFHHFIFWYLILVSFLINCLSLITFPSLWEPFEGWKLWVTACWSKFSAIPQS